MLNDRNAVLGQLSDLAREIDNGDPQGAMRLTELRNAVDGGKYADAWAANDIYNLINIDAIVNRYRVQQTVDKTVTWLDTARNVFIFLPLLCTWWGISRAIPAYYTLVTQYPKYDTTPFLQLWQGGFNDSIPWTERLGGVAGIDAVLILVIVVLTIASSYFTNVSQLQRDQKAEALRDSLAHALAGATLFLSTRHWTQPTNFVDRFNTVVDDFNGVVSGLEEQMKQEREALSQLAERQRKEFELFNSFKSVLVGGMDELSSSIKGLKSSQETLKTTIDDLVTPTQEATTQQKTLLGHADTIQQQLTRQASAQEEVVTQQKRWGERLDTVLVALDNTVGKAVNGTTTLAGDIVAYNETQKELLQKLQVEHNDLDQLVKDIISKTDAMDRIIKQIDESATNINGVTVNMGDITRRIAARMPVLPDGERG